MKTNIDIAIESNTQDEKDWLFSVDPKDDNADWVRFNELTDDRRAAVCKEYGVTEDFMYEIVA